MLLVGTSAALCVLGESSGVPRIWITADRRGEVCVVFESQTEVANVMNGILCLHHSTEGYHLDEVVLGLPSQSAISLFRLLAVAPLVPSVFIL